MPIFDKIIGGGVASLVDSLANTADKFITTGEEKNAFKLEMQAKLYEAERIMEESYQKEIEGRTEIIKAEMAQTDIYTKRARPTIIYGGLLFIFLVYVLFPMLAYLTGAEKMPELNLPAEFWWSWGTVVSVYGAGRSAEKMGFTNKITGLITGNNPVKTKTK